MIKLKVSDPTINSHANNSGNESEIASITKV